MGKQAEDSSCCSYSVAPLLDSDTKTSLETGVLNGSPMASDSSCFVSSMCSVHLLQQVNSASPDCGRSLGHMLSNRSPPLVSGLVKAERCPWEPWAVELFAILSGDPILPDFRVISLPPSLWLAWVPGRCGTSWFTYTADLSPWGSGGFCSSIGFSACSFTAPTRL